MRERVRQGRWHVAALFVLTSALTLAAFGNTLRAGFVYDDEWTIQHNAHLDAPLGSLLGACVRGDARRLRIPDATRPAMVASTWVDHRLFGARPLGFHADSLCLAALTSALAGLAVFAITRRRRMAALAAAIFAVAPLHAEVVAAVHDREDLLAALGLFGVLALLFWPRGATAHTVASRARAGGAVALAGALWLLGLAAKESAAVLVPLAACAWCLQSGSRRRRWLGAREPMLLALLAVGIVWANWRLGLRFGADDVPVARGVSLAGRLLRSARYEAWAAAQSLLPVLSAPEHARQGPASVAWVAALAGLVALTVGMARRRDTRVPALGLAIVLVAPLAASPLVGPVNEQADRYLFAGVLGGAIVWAWAIERLARRAGRRVGLGVAVVVACGLVVQSARSAAAWHDDRSLWTEATRVAPGSARAWAGLSRAVRLEGDVARALALSRRALALDPFYAPAHLTNAYNLICAGRRDEALADLAYAEEHAPDMPGLARARACASRAAEAAAACIDAPTAP